MSHHKVEVRNLHFSYPDGHEALKKISFTILHGESVGIIGANGAGKSTILMLLMGILYPDSGDVLVGDVHLTKKTLPMIRQRLGMVFQNPDDQLFMTNVYDDVAFGPRNYRLDEKEVDSRVMNALDLVGISDLKDRAPFRLSGGEKRAASIACVLSMQPEPSSTLGAMISVIAPESCIGCGECELTCPDFAIYVAEKSEHKFSKLTDAAKQRAEAITNNKYRLPAGY